MSPYRCKPTQGLKIRPGAAKKGRRERSRLGAAKKGQGPGPGPFSAATGLAPRPGAQPCRSQPGLTGCWSLREDDLRLDRGPLRAPTGRLPARAATWQD